MFQPTKNNMCRSFSDIWRFLPNFSSLNRKGGRQSKFWNSVTSLHWYWSRGIMNNQLSFPTFLPWTKCAPVGATRRSWKVIIIIMNIENNVNININILSSTEFGDKRFLCYIMSLAWTGAIWSNQYHYEYENIEHQIWILTTSVLIWELHGNQKRCDDSGKHTRM